MVIKYVPLSSPTSDKVCTFVEIKCIMEIEGETLSGWVATSQGIESIGVKVEDFRNVDGLVEQLNTYNVGHWHKYLREKLKD
jgi:hypothetical protein